MKSELEIINKAEAYLRGELSSAERFDFETLRAGHPAIDQLVVDHYSVMKQLADMGAQQRLVTSMEDIHSQLDIPGLKREVTPQVVKVKTLWARHRFNLAIAASVAIVAVLSTLLSTGYFNKDAAYAEMNRKIEQQGKIINNVKNHISRGPVNPGNFGGTGFAFSSNCLISNYHVIKGADSIYVQNESGESFRVETVYTDQANDIAVLKITDPGFTPFSSLPYSIRKAPSDLGEDVFTIGYPREDDLPVIGKGYLSSQTGDKGDTTAYQVSIDVNPGNSGSPLLDYKGNVVGMIKGKNRDRDGAVFATRSDFLLKAITALPEDITKTSQEPARKNSFSRLSKIDQINKMKKYIFIVRAYK